MKNVRRLLIIAAACLGIVLDSSDVLCQSENDTSKYIAENSQTDRSSWFSKSLEYKGIAVQDDNWHIWGCSPIIGPEGKVHLFVARWPEETGHEGRYTDSQIAHYVGETSEGPFKLWQLLAGL